MSEPAIVVNDLHRKFGAVEALRGVSFTVNKGELYGLVGPDAAGKTTTMRSLAGLIVLDSGEATILGRHPDDPIVREQVGLMPQQFSLYGDLSVVENLTFFGELFAIPKKTWQERVDRLMAITRLGRFMDRRADALSGGMYKKLALSCALLHEPPILLLDEPTNGVDPVSRRDLWGLLHDFVEGGMTVLVSTPYMDEAERCHRVALMHRGRIIAEDEPTTIAEGYPTFEEAFIALTAEAA